MKIETEYSFYDFPFLNSSPLPQYDRPNMEDLNCTTGNGYFLKDKIEVLYKGNFYYERSLNGIPISDYLLDFPTPVKMILRLTVLEKGRERFWRVLFGRWKIDSTPDMKIPHGYQIVFDMVGTIKEIEEKYFEKG
jgi:hypothetical protein